MMKKKMFLAFMAFAALAIVGCSNDDNETEQPDVPERQDVTGFDDLEYFQEYFINVDSLGNFVSRSIGIPLPVYDEDTTHIFIGVEDIEEALTYWADCLPPIDEIRPLMNGNYPYTYTLTDKEGRSQGTVTFAPNTEPGFVADITTDVPGLRHFKKVTFVQNDSWPVDFTEGQYHFGDVRTITFSYDGSDWYKGELKRRTMKFVCLREKGRGVKPLYVSITPEDMKPEEDYALLLSDYCPEKSDAMMIYRIINDYGFTKAIDLFAQAGEGALKSDEYYWLNGFSLNRLGNYYWEAIRLSDGYVNRWDINYYDPHNHALLKVDWLDD